MFIICLDFFSQAIRNVGQKNERNRVTMILLKDTFATVDAEEWFRVTVCFDQKHLHRFHASLWLLSFLIIFFECLGVRNRSAVVKESKAVNLSGERSRARSTHNASTSFTKRGSPLSRDSSGILSLWPIHNFYFQILPCVLFFLWSLNFLNS